MIEKKIYQNIEVEGEDIGFTKAKKGSKFCNEGKWENYIKPHLPEDCSDMTFTELGANAGLFLKLAKDHGFRNVVGYDKSKRTVKQGLKFRDECGYDYTLINERIDKDFDVDKLPASDYVLMSNFHYYLEVADFIKIIERLRFKTRHVIIVTADVEDKWMRAKSYIEDIRYYFREWKEVGYCRPLKIKGDSFPRIMESIVFKSPLERRPVDDLYKMLRMSQKANVEDFAKKLIENDIIENIKDTNYYNELRKLRKFRKEKNLLKHIDLRLKNLKDMKKNGVIEPIVIYDNNKIADGNHRFMFLKQSGYESVIVRII